MEVAGPAKSQCCTKKKIKKNEKGDNLKIDASPIFHFFDDRLNCSVNNYKRNITSICNYLHESTLHNVHNQPLTCKLIPLLNVNDSKTDSPVH